jgi:hypothetical protein
VVTWQYFHPVEEELKMRGVGTLFFNNKKEEVVVDDSLNPLWVECHNFDLVTEMPVLRNVTADAGPAVSEGDGLSVIECVARRR